MLGLYPVGKNSPIMVWPDGGKYSCVSYSHPEMYLGVASGAGSSGEWNVCGDNVVGIGGKLEKISGGGSKVTFPDFSGCDFRNFHFGRPSKVSVVP